MKFDGYPVTYPLLLGVYIAYTVSVVDHYSTYSQCGVNIIILYIQENKDRQRNQTIIVCDNRQSVGDKTVSFYCNSNECLTMCTLQLDLYT